MLTFNARQLLRGLDVASYPARLADEPVGARLTTVPLEVTDQGLIAYSTDRYQLARTLTEYALEAPAHGAGLPPVRLHRSGLKVLLPVLRAAKKDGTVELTADKDTVTFTVHAANGQVQTATVDLTENVPDGFGFFGELDAEGRLEMGDELRDDFKPSINTDSR